MFLKSTPSLARPSTSYIKGTHAHTHAHTHTHTHTHDPARRPPPITPHTHAHVPHGCRLQVAELYADPGFHAAADRHFNFQTGVPPLCGDSEAAAASGKPSPEATSAGSLAADQPQDGAGGAAKRGLKRQISTVGASVEPSQPVSGAAAVPVDTAQAVAPAKKKNKKKKRDL